MTSMPYLRACIKEAARIIPIVIGTGRQLTEEVVVCGYRIPAGVDIAMSQPIFSRDPDIFRRAGEFIPERFVKGSAGEPTLGAQHPFGYLPFGFGARMCIGKRFAELEVEVLIAK